MPLVTLTRDPKVISDQVVRKLRFDLQRYVANLLQCEGGGELTADDIEIRVREPGPLDFNFVAFQVEVTASDLPDRRRNIQDRTQSLANLIADHPAMPKGVVNTSSAFVWVMLVQAGFVLF